MSTEAERTTDNLPQWKVDEVEELSALLETYENIGVVGIAGIPSRQLQAMRRDLHGTAVLRVSRNTLLVRALRGSRTGRARRRDSPVRSACAARPNENPFALYRELEASKTPAPIGEGEVAPNDIVLEAGDTGIDPGPFVGELQQIGANARIEEGSIQVMEDSTVLETGETVSKQLENVLNELEIEPKEVGLDLQAVVSEGVRFEPEDLDIDVEAYRDDVAAASARAWNLAINAEIATAATAAAMLSRAASDARVVGVSAAIEDEAFVPDLVTVADGRVRALASQIDDEEALPEPLRDIEIQTQATTEPADEESTDDRPDADTPDDEEPAADDDDDDDDDDDAGAEGLGAMFG
ncbi:MAG: 50S ribosomal protein L10 [Natrialbaceae archaeon]|nr:50S ribosomal protein L10 [Natrialbaceae archaeon]